MHELLQISIRPRFHWSDQKIRVHIFYCVLALTLCSLLQRELHRKGVDRSIPDLLDTLGKIHEVAVVYPSQGPNDSPTIKTTLSEMSEHQRLLFDALELNRHVPG